MAKGKKIDVAAESVEQPEATVFNPELVETVKANPHILNVWVNEAGDWYFCDRPGFTSYSREDILNG